MKIAMIGSGNIAARHLRSLAEIPDVELRAHVDRVLPRARAAAEEWGGRPYGGRQEMLDREAPDAVWVCVPPAFHGEIERDLIERRLPFFVEKPLSADRDTAHRIASSVATAGLIAAVGYQWRALDTLPELRETLVANPARLALGVWLDATPGTPWWQRQEISGGQVIEQATHLFDLARNLLGEARVLSAAADSRPRPAFPDMTVADVTAAMLRYQGGQTGVFAVTCALAGTAAVHLQLVCDGLLVTVTGQGVVYDYGRERERREVRVANDPILDEDRAFLEAVRADDPSRVVCPYSEALRTHDLCCDVREAAKASVAQPEGAE